MELIVITASKETGMFWNDFKTPTLTVMMRDVDELLLVTFDIKCHNSAIVVSNDNLVMHHVNRWGQIRYGKLYSSDKFELTCLDLVHSDHAINTCRHEYSLVTSNSSTLPLVSFKSNAKISVLIPAMEHTIHSTSVSNTIPIECSAKEFGHLKLVSKWTSLINLLGSISWIPELYTSCCESNESEIVDLLRPLYIKDGILTSGHLDDHFLLVNIVNRHDVLVAFIHCSHISLAWTHANWSTPLGS